VIFLGLTVAGPEEEFRLIKGLQMKFNLTPEKAESLLQRVPIVVKKSVSKEEMERYVNVFKEIGGRVRIEEESVVEPLEISQRPAPGPEPKKELQGKKSPAPNVDLNNLRLMSASNAVSSSPNIFNIRRWPVLMKARFEKYHQEENIPHGRTGRDLSGLF
jgi:hypothetical protein